MQRTPFFSFWNINPPPLSRWNSLHNPYPNSSTFGFHLRICCNLNFGCIPYSSPIFLNIYKHHQCHKTSQEIISHVLLCHFLFMHLVPQHPATWLFSYGVLHLVIFSLLSPLWICKCSCSLLFYLCTLPNNLPPCCLSFPIHRVSICCYCTMCPLTILSCTHYITSLLYRGLGCIQLFIIYVVYDIWVERDSKISWKTDS